MNTTIIAMILALALGACAQTPESDETDPNTHPVEQGRISWLRDLDQVKDRERPILLLFQEVPG